MKENADVNRRKKVFEEGEEVLLATKDFNLS
jgi:phosphoribosyl-ATP pyrophosphohydrolase